MAEAGAQVVEKAVQSIGEVQQMPLELKGDMAQLNARAQDITRIMGVISDIAGQTNLLTLDAASEATQLASRPGRGPGRDRSHGGSHGGLSQCHCHNQ